MSQETGKWIIVIGAVIMMCGVIWYFLGDKLGFIGHLPGDFRIEKENFIFYFPLTTMVIISIIANILIKLIRLFLNS